MVVTTRPGYEMKGAHSPNHVGGGAMDLFMRKILIFLCLSEGRMKKLDSIRMVDLKAFILDLIK